MTNSKVAILINRIRDLEDKIRELQDRQVKFLHTDHVADGYLVAASFDQELAGLQHKLGEQKMKLAHLNERIRRWQNSRM